MDTCQFKIELQYQFIFNFMVKIQKKTLQESRHSSPNSNPKRSHPIAPFNQMHSENYFYHFDTGMTCWIRTLPCSFVFSCVSMLQNLSTVHILSHLSHKTNSWSTTLFNWADQMSIMHVQIIQCFVISKSSYYWAFKAWGLSYCKMWLISLIENQYLGQIFIDVGANGPIYISIIQLTKPRP